MKIIIRIASWTITSLVCSIFAGIYSLMIPYEKDVYHFSFLEQFIYGLVYFTPLFIIIFVSISILIDLGTYSINSYLFKLFFYLIIGSLLAFILPYQIEGKILIAISFLIFFGIFHFFL